MRIRSHTTSNNNNDANHAYEFTFSPFAKSAFFAGEFDWKETFESSGFETAECGEEYGLNTKFIKMEAKDGNVK